MFALKSTYAPRFTSRCSYGIAWQSFTPAAEEDIYRSNVW